LGNQVLADPKSSCWKQRFDSVFCAIKFLVFVTLAVEVILIFLIWLRLRAALAVMLGPFAIAASRVGFLWSKFYR
jgi:hypothetical protein